MVMGMFWLIAFINCYGMKSSNYLTSISAIIGTIVPIGFVILLGAIWIFSGHNSQIVFTARTFFPDLTNINTLAFLTSVLFSLMGMEMAAQTKYQTKFYQQVKYSYGVFGSWFLFDLPGCN